MSLDRQGRPYTPASHLPLRVLQAVVVYWLALKVAALFVGQPHSDEAYYWLWGQHLALSYLDHPPFHAWLQAGVAAALGWNLFALRFLTLITAGLTLWILFVWAKRIEPDNWRPRFWLSAALFYSSPLLMLYTTVAIHDRVLVVLALASVNFFALFLTDWVQGERRFRWLYLGAFFLGLATLTKYTGALIGVGVAVAILVRADLRSLLRSPHLYLAALLAVAMQAPMLYWNAMHGIASAQLHLSLGFQGPMAGMEHVKRILLETVVLLSPFAILPIMRFIGTRPAGGFGGTAHGLGQWIFASSTIAILTVAFFRDALFYWNIIAYALFFALGAWAFRTALVQALHIAWGVILGTALLVHFSVAPVLPAPHVGYLFGWEEGAVAVRDARAETGADFVAANGWRNASQLAFALGNKDVASLSPDRDGFDYWFDDGLHQGLDAIVVLGPSSRMPLSRFAEFEKLGEVRFGRTDAMFGIYLGRGFIPETESP